MFILAVVFQKISEKRKYFFLVRVGFFHLKETQFPSGWTTNSIPNYHSGFTVSFQSQPLLASWVPSSSARTVSAAARAIRFTVGSEFIFLFSAFRYGLLLPVPQQNLLGSCEQYYMLQEDDPVPQLDWLVCYFPAPPLQFWGCADFLHQCHIY